MLRYLCLRRPGIAVTPVLLVVMLLVLTVAPQVALAQSYTASINPNQGQVGMQNSQVVVTSNVQWVNTGITLNTGDTLNVSASGSWSADPGDGPTTPDGYTQQSPDNFLNLTDIGVCSSCASTPTSHWGALIGYIGTNPPVAGSYTSTSILPEAQKVFVVGSNFQSSAEPTGNLWLNFNDDAYSANTGDNAGQVTATVTDTPSTKPLGGTWINPADGFTVTNGPLHFAAHAYGGVGGVNHVNFTIWWSAIGRNPWFIACKVFNPTPGTTDVYECDWNLKDGKGHPIPSGKIKVGFDVYDNGGNRILSPNGVHSGTIEISSGRLVIPSTGTITTPFLQQPYHEHFFPKYYDQNNVLNPAPQKQGAHSGIDIAGPGGNCTAQQTNPVYAAGVGTVMWVGFDTGGFGWSVVVMHGNGFRGSIHYVYTLYAHMGTAGTTSGTSNSCVRVKVGDKTDTTTVLGYQGTSGNSTGVHLHLTFFVGDQKVTQISSIYDFINKYNTYPASPDFYVCVPLTFGDSSIQGFVNYGDNNC